MEIVQNVKGIESGLFQVRMPTSHQTGKLSCLVRSPIAFTAIGPKGEKLPVKQQIKDGESVITIDTLKGWEYILLTTR